MNRSTVFAASLLIGLSAFATVYWQGSASVEGRWSAKDNPKPGSEGFYWNTAADGKGTWKALPVDENAMVQHGGTLCIGSEDGLVDYVQKLVLDYNKPNATCVRLDAGGLLTNAIVYVGHGSGSSGSLFHVNGGQAWIGSDKEGLMIPSTSGKRTGGATYAVRVSDGLLDVSGNFSVAGTDQGTDANSSTMTIEGGTVVSHCDVAVGVDSATAVNRGRIDLKGGSLTVAAGKSLKLNRLARLDQSDGNLDAQKMTIKGGVAVFSGGTAGIGQIEFVSGGEAVVSGAADLTAGLDLADDTVVAGAANLLMVSNGTVKLSSAASGNAFLPPVNPFRLCQLGGTVNLEKLYIGQGESGLLKLEIDGGELTCGKIATFGQPFYLRHRGSATVSFAEFAANSAANKNNCATNCMVEHVIAGGVLEPLAFGAGRRIFGYNVLRPEGGVQLIATNRFALFRFSGIEPVTEAYRSGIPAEDLWTSRKFSDANEWGSTLKASARVGAKQGHSYGGTFSERPAGYVELPSIDTNILISLSVELSVIPQGKTLSELREDIEKAGYENVAAKDDGVLTFDVPFAFVPDRSKTTSLVFDFRETPCPTTFTETPMTFTTTTNALVTGVQVMVMKQQQGLVILFK